MLPQSPRRRRRSSPRPQRRDPLSSFAPKGASSRVSALGVARRRRSLNPLPENLRNPGKFKSEACSVSLAIKSAPRNPPLPTDGVSKSRQEDLIFVGRMQQASQNQKS
uniref:Uncharacterized protein n=1 Tax=Sphaerodactylus townsendi TaxID=933632 RepID=A0ACB8EBR3_9SAUR